MLQKNPSTETIASCGAQHLLDPTEENQECAVEKSIMQVAIR